MRERGIIFNAEMVRAVLEGRKTQTRRIMKVQPVSPELELSRIIESTRRTEDGKFFWREPGSFVNNRRSVLFSCPFGEVGDRLWVRETWAEAGGSAPELQLYRANYPTHVPSKYENVPPAESIRWRPSIHMPRWASRIKLEITGVRVERLTALSDDDARNEGCPAQLPHNPEDEHQARTWFRGLWSEMYGEESWQANPWVWVIEFRKLEAKS